LHFAVELGRRIEKRFPPLRAERTPRIGWTVWIAASDEELPFRRKRRRQKLGVPTLARANIKDSHRRLESKKFESLDRMAILVAIGVPWFAMLARDRRRNGCFARRINLVGECLRGG